jgi:hypothetical protein
MSILSRPYSHSQDHDLSNPCRDSENLPVVEEVRMNVTGIHLNTAIILDEMKEVAIASNISLF